MRGIHKIHENLIPDFRKRNNIDHYSCYHQNFAITKKLIHIRFDRVSGGQGLSRNNHAGIDVIFF